MVKLRTQYGAIRIRLISRAWRNNWAQLGNKGRNSAQSANAKGRNTAQLGAKGRNSVHYGVFLNKNSIWTLACSSALNI
jgi:hypothetical protein